MSVGIQVKTTAISTVVDLVQSHVFSRICDEMHRVQLAHPAPLEGETAKQHGDRKRHIVIEDCKIIFTDLVEPVGESVIRLLIEIGMIYLKTL
jgi:hypothetical protein